MGGRKRLEKLENSVSALQKQVADPVVEEPIEVIEEQEPIVEEPDLEISVRIEDVDESEEEDQDVEVIPASISAEHQKILNDLNQMGFVDNDVNMELIVA